MANLTNFSSFNALHNVKNQENNDPNEEEKEIHAYEEMEDDDEKGSSSSDQGSNDFQHEDPTGQECLHHGRRQFNHDGPVTKQEMEEYDPKSQLTYYCEDCREFCCEYCIALGPHNNELHKPSLLSKFAEAKSDFISDLLKGAAKKKCFKLFYKIKQINQRIELISNQALVIERDAFIQFTHILDRLNQAEGKKISILQNDIARLQRDINTIEDCVKSFENLSSKQDRLHFLLFYRSLNFRMTQALSIHFKKNIDEVPYDLPRELQAMKLQMENFKPNDEILKFKDFVIWTLKENEQKTVEQICQEQSKAISQKLELWTKLASVIFQEFEGLQLICHYCGELINDESINTDCFANLYKRDRDMSIPITVYSDQTVEKGIFGTKRHYWVQPRLKDRQIKLGRLPNIIPGKKKRINKDVAYYNYMKIYSLMFYLIKKKKTEKSLDLHTILKAYDKENTEEDFTNRAAEFLGVSQQGYEKAMNLTLEIPDSKATLKRSENPFLREYDIQKEATSDEGESVYVNYLTFLRIIKDPLQLELEAFKLIDYYSIKQHGENFFVQLDESIFKQFQLDKLAKKGDKQQKFVGLVRAATPSKEGNKFFNLIQTLKKK